MKLCARSKRKSAERSKDFVPCPCMEVEDRDFLHERLITALETIDTEQWIARIIMDRLRELDMLHGEAA